MESADIKNAKVNVKTLTNDGLFECFSNYKNSDDELERLLLPIVIKELELRGLNYKTENMYLSNDGEIKFPLNTKYTIVRSMDFKTLGLITLFSKFNGKVACDIKGVDYSNVENHRYIYESNINEDKEVLEGLSNNKIRTIKRNIKKLVDCDNNVVVQMNQEGKIYYKINPYAQKDVGRGSFVTIEESILRYMVNVYNSNTIKAYCTIKWLLFDKVNKVYIKRQLTRDFLCRMIGLSPNSKNNLQLMTDILNSLVASGLIKRSMKIDTSTSKENGQTQTKTIYEYEICTAEEFNNHMRNIGK
ncbi:hypothetical protein [Clostridium sp.]|uniref:hypothetical protein n=1 Tax=Clostridium sp. TaxID=1506 RepID=UPI003F36BC71